MRILLIGGIHASPICRQRCIAKLKSLNVQLGAPVFIAVESSRKFFDEIYIRKRKTFFSLAKNDEVFNSFGDSFIEELTRSISYETDAHKEVTWDGNKPAIIWLDQHRDNEETDPKLGGIFGETHFNFLKRPLANMTIPEPGSAQQLVHNCIFDGDDKISQEKRYQRDEKWFELMQKTIDEESLDGYGVVIVGIDHISDHPLSICSRLKDIYDCEKIDISCRI